MGEFIYRHKHFLTLLVLIAGFFLAHGVASYIHNQDMEGNKRAFSAIAQESVSLIRNNIETHKQIVERLAAFFMSSSSVDRSEFDLYTSSIFKTHDELDAIGWISTPDTLNQLKKDYSETVKYYGIPKNIRDSIAPEGFYYFSHLRPLSTQKNAIGTYIRDDTDFLDVVKQTIITGQPSYFLKALPFLNIQNIHKDKDQIIHLIMIFPAIAKDSNNNIFSKGIGFSIIDIDNLVGDEVLSKPEGANFDLSVRAWQNNHEYDLLMPKHLISDFSYTEKIQIGKSLLEFTFVPNEKFFNQQKSYAYHVIFITILSLSFFITFYLWELKEHVEILQKSRTEADKANRLKSEFLATMSHEIRSPMTGVIGMAELLQATPLNDQQARYTATILNSGEQLLQIIEDILDFSKIEADKVEINPIPVDLLELVDDIAALYAVKARQKALEIVVRYVPGTPRFIYADPVRIKQILTNLVLNSIKFTHHGFIAILIEQDKLSKATEGMVNISFSIMDTGIGIETEAQNKIFDKFLQADSSTTRQFGGTGLGLSICKRLIEMMGGTIKVRSALGEGSIFYFTIAFNHNSREIMHHPKANILQGIKAMIVDDISMVQTVVAEQLQSIGMECNKANTAAEALTLMQSASRQGRPYDIIIIDYLMPGQDGKDLAAAIRADQNLKDTCLVMLTGFGTSLLSEELDKYNFAAYISKPLRTRAMIDTLIKTWERHKPGTQQTLIVDQFYHPNRVAQDSKKYKIEANILVVEDDSVNQAYGRAILEEMGCTVMTALNGQHALNILAEGHLFDLILMDCQMPVMDGFEATHKIMLMKQQGLADPAMKIIALTANAMKGDRERCLEAGMDDYLTKPIRKNDLQKAIHKYIIEKKNPGLTPFIAPIETLIVDMDAAEHAKAVFKENYASMISAYLSNTESHIQNIKNAIAANNASDAILPAHTIKSSSRTMGAALLCDLAAKLEMNILNSEGEPCNYTIPVQDIQNQLEKIQATFEKTKATFEKMAA